MLRDLRLSALALLVLLPGARPASAQCVSLTTLGSASTQSFDTLSSTAGSTTNNLTITGWFLTESGLGGRDNEQYAVDTGGSNTGDMYSYGAAGSGERALGELRSGTLIPIFGACFTNNTGATITSLDVAYTGEQWRLGTTARTDQINFEHSLNATSLTTGTWTGTAALNFVSPDTGTTGAKNGNGAANRTARAAAIPALSIANGATFWIRWTDADATGADDGLAVDDFALTPQGGPGMPGLNVGDVTLAEGDAGTTTFTFPVTLTAPAGPGGVTFDIATADGTAQDDNPATEDEDYVAQSLTGQSIPLGSTGPYNFSVTVNGDTEVEPNETFFVNVTNVVGATAGDGQGTGTVNNDDVSITPIHDIQGPGGNSPIVGASVITRGIVTGVKSNGFFIQEPDAMVDADPATSEAVLVFTGGAPPAAAMVGNMVQVTGTVSEFVPTQDPFQPPLTELTSPTVILLSAGHPLPAPVPLTATFPDPAGPFDQLERLEGMRVSVTSLTVVGPTLGNINEANATATSSGVFFGVVTGVARPHREAGVQQPDPLPAGSPCCVPRFDTNPERIRVDSDGLVGGAAANVSTGTVVTGLAGPLDYTFRTYTVLPDPASPPGFAGGASLQAVSAPGPDELTIATANLQRFYDTTNDPGTSDAVLTAAAFDGRLAKASEAIRDFLLMPDIIGVVEMEDLATLQTLAARISSDAVAAGQSDPEYDSFLVEGNDIGGIDVGFLVKTAPVVGATPRVTVVSVTQEGLADTFVNPNTGASEILNDRPPLVLEAEVNDANGASFPVTVIVNHLRSLNDVASEDPNGSGTLGNRVRHKRRAQAEFLADLVQARQTVDPNERIVLVGDFNAFAVNDGFVDSIGTILGMPAPADQVVLASADLVDPDLVNLITTEPAAERYSYVFDGNAQSLDHVLVNEDVATATVPRLEHARINADFPETDRNDFTSPVRISDHDPAVAYFQVAEFTEADLSVTKVEGADPVVAGTNLTWTITVTNSGPATASSVVVEDTLPAGTTFVSHSTSDFSCTTPAVGAAGLVSCTAASLPPGSASITLVARVDPSVAAGTVLSNTAMVSSATADPDSADDSATEMTTVSAAAEVSVTHADSPDPVTAGTTLTWTTTVTNAGPSDAANAAVTITVPAGTGFVQLLATAGWSCVVPSPDAAGTVTCSLPSMPPGSAVFTVEATVSSGLAAGTTLTSNAAFSSDTPDSAPGNESVDAVTTVAAAPPSPAALTATKTASGTFAPGSTVTYTIVLANNGGTAQPDNPGAELTDILPAQLALTGATASSGTATATLATNTVTWNGAVPAGGSVTITIQATLAPGTAGQTVTNQAIFAFDADGNGTNESPGTSQNGSGGGPTVFTVGEDPVTATEVPTLGEWGLILLALALGLLGTAQMRRRARI